MPGVVDDLLDRKASLESDRRPWEAHWDDVSRYVATGMERVELNGRMNAAIMEPTAAKQAPEIYDHTSIWAVDRLTAGEISLVMPSNAMWHTLRSSDPFAGDPSDVEEEWYDSVTEYLFKTRYNPVSGFMLASKAMVKSRVAFGTGVMYVEEAMGRASAPISYRFVPLFENFLDTNFEGVIDTNFRLFNRTARQCVERWGDACSQRTKDAANDEAKKNTSVQILHAVFPRTESARDTGGRAYHSFYVEVQEQHLIGSGGYHDFPFVVAHWNREHQGPYAEGPVAIAIAEIKSLNMLSKQEYIATQQWINPPTAQRSDDHNRPNLSPGAPNPGMLSETGELLVKPIMTQQRPDFARTIIEAKQNQIRESLYVNLWQILIQNPQMTATEAMIRAQEKADLLGPSGLSLQEALSAMLDREIGILERKGAFRPGAALEIPQSAQGRNIGATFTGPLDKMRRASEVIGIERTLQMASVIAGMGKPEVLERFDFDEILDITQDVNGAPRKIFRTQEEIDANKANAENMQQIASLLQNAQAGGEAAKSVGEGLTALQGAAQ